MTPGTEHLHINGMKVWQFPFLFKLSSKGEVLLWQVTVRKIEGADGVSVETTTGPAFNVDKQKVAKKNIQATKQDTAYDRAIKLNHTKYKNKLKHGYFETVEDAQSTEKPKMPMLVSEVTEEDIFKLPSDMFPLYASPKKNGVHGFHKKDDEVIQSRNLKPFGKLTDLAEQCNTALDIIGRNFLGMELYAPGHPINEQISLVRNGDDRVQAWVFDTPGPGTAKERQAIIAKLNQYTKLLPRVKVIPVRVIKTAADLFKYYQEQVTLGEEGIICRTMDGEYKWNNKTTRDKRIFKVKPLISDEFGVVSCGIESRIHEGKTYYLIEFVCETYDGKYFKVSPTSWGMDKRHEIGIAWKRMNTEQRGEHVRGLAPLTLEFREYTTTGKPFHIKEVISRDYE